MTQEPSRHKILIIGGGVAGVELASVLARREGRHGLQVTLVDRDSAHIWKPMLHTIAAGTRNLSAQQTTYIAQARLAGFSYQPGELHGLDRSRKVVKLGPLYAPDGRVLIDARELPYDTLIVAIGSRANDFGTPGVAEHCRCIDSRTQADAFNQELRLRMMQCMAQQQDLPIAIVGGGATGVELAAELIQFVESAVGYGATGLRERLSVTLIESGPRLLPAFPEDISSATRHRLERLGIQVMTDARVSVAHADRLELADGTQIPAALSVWAAGVKGAEVLSRLDGLESNRSHQLLIQPSLRTTLDPDIFAVGDCASLTPAGAERPLPPTAQIAHQHARHLIRHLPAAIRSAIPIPDFVYHDFGALVSLGEYDAFGSLGQFGLLKGSTIKGRLAQLSHAMLYRSHQARLSGFWRGGLLWLADRLNACARPSIRLD